MKTNKIPLRQYIAVLGITIAAFIFNISEFMPIGLLSDIASNFQQTEAETGIMITAYAWVVAVLSLPLMLMVTKMELKKLLIATITLFCIGQIVSGSAVNFIMLLAGRICVACAHSIFWSIAAPIAVQLVSKEHRSMGAEHGSDRNVSGNDFWPSFRTYDWIVFRMAHDVYDDCRYCIFDNGISVFRFSASYQSIDIFN